jgi:light-regulated signal transduction histidine kinase (bacteriophytochrome)
MLEQEQASADEVSDLRLELDRLRIEFDKVVSLLSHNLYEPLRQAQCCAEAIKENEIHLDSDSRQHLERIEEALARVRDIVRGISSLSQLHTREMKFERTDLDVVLRWVMVQMQDILLRRDAEITHNQLIPVKGDPEVITQVMQHLLDNSLKFTGTSHPAVQVAARREGPWVVVSVADNGIGVEPDHREMCFGIFKRLHPRSRYPGEGIGLAYCREAIERHGGRIWMDMTPGGGTTVQFTLRAPESSEA